MTPARAAIILAAGQGTRMRSAIPKVFHEVGGRRLIDWALATTAALACARVVTVVGAHAPAVGEYIKAKAGLAAIQDPPLGTAHAVLAAKGAMAGFSGDVVVLFGDTPLIRPETIEAMFALRAARGGMVVLGFTPEDPTDYGRLVEAGGVVTRIVEERDATDEEKKIRLCNSGVFVADATVLFQLLSMVRNENAKGEYYLTDLVGLGRSAGFATHVAMGEEGEVLGVNSRADLAHAEAAFQARARAAALEAGVTLVDPQTVYFSYDTEIEPDVVIEPGVFLGPGVRIASGARICAFSHCTDAVIGPQARVGPFARLRPGARIGEGAHIGNFVEVKNVDVGPGAKANHLAYLGDGVVGARANIGAGAIFCNYDGYEKFQTHIGADAFIGSDTALVAPVKVGERAYTGSGSVITKDVPDGALALGRARQVEIQGWADQFRVKKRAGKEKKT